MQYAQRNSKELCKEIAEKRTRIKEKTVEQRKAKQLEKIFFKWRASSTTRKPRGRKKIKVICFSWHIKIFEYEHCGWPISEAHFAVARRITIDTATCLLSRFLHI